MQSGGLRIRNPANPMYNHRNNLLYEKTGITPILMKLKKLSKEFGSKQIENIKPLRTRIKHEIRRPEFSVYTTYQRLKIIANADDI